jgi:NIMA (never in mitosis gene a)-related kinase
MSNQTEEDKTDKPEAERANIEAFEFLKKLGEGAYSSVYKVRRKADNEMYALKKVKMKNLSSKEKQNSLNEVRILASINHPNVISYKEAFFEADSLYIVMEYADNGDVFGEINTKKKKEETFKE